MDDFSKIIVLPDNLYVKVPVYDFKTNARVPGEFTNVFPSDVVIVEGILIFYYKNMRFELNIVDF